MTLNQGLAQEEDSSNSNTNNNNMSVNSYIEKVQELLKTLQKSQSQLSKSIDGITPHQSSLSTQGIHPHDLEYMLKLSSTQHAVQESKKHGLASFGAL